MEIKNEPKTQLCLIAPVRWMTGRIIRLDRKSNDLIISVVLFGQIPGTVCYNVF